MKLLESLFLEGVCPAIVNAVSDGVYIIDRQRRIVFWNRAAENISGYKREEVLQTSCADNLLNHVNEIGLSLCQNTCPAAQCLEDGEPRKAKVFLHHKNGHRLPVNIEIHPLREGDQIVGVLEVFRINDQDRMFREDYLNLQQKAYIDELTGAWNRRSLLVSLERKLEQLRRFGWDFAVALIDIDKFKDVNDTFGHLVGDKVLAMVCRTIMFNSRSIDELYRYGGEELVLLLSGVRLDWQVKAIGEKMRSLVESSFLLENGRRISVTVSIGVTYALPSDTVDSLLHRADTNMYLAKNSGRNCVHACHPPLSLEPESGHGPA